MNTAGKKLFLIPAICAMAVVLYAGLADEQQLGDRAFYADDYRTAAEHYRSAQKLSEDDINAESWAYNTLRLGKTLLFAGDIEGAKAALKDFRTRQPMRSAGTLPADILAAENKFDEAEKRYLAIEDGEDAALAEEAKFGRGVLLLKFDRLAEAGSVFRDLLKTGNEPLRHAANRELIYTLIRQNKCAEADKVLATVPDSARGQSYAVLTALSKVKSGDFTGFKKNWRTLVENNLRFPDSRCCEVLISAADAMEKQKDFALSAELLKAADRFAATPEIRQNILKRVINLQSGFDPEAAAASATEYAGIFPEAADRFKILFSAADILGSAEKFMSAATLLKQLTSSATIPRWIRCQAAVNGAAFAEKANDAALASQFHQTAVQDAPDLSTQIVNRRKYAGFLMRQRDYRKAVEVLKQALEISGDSAGDSLKYEVLDAAVKADDKTLIERMASELKNSVDPRCLCRAYYEFANLSAQQKDYNAARKNFLAAAKVDNGGEYAVAGGFGAALMAFNLGDFKNAGAESLALAVANPDVPQTPQALYLGYRAARQLNNEELKARCARLLTEKYSSSEAYAVYALQHAADRADSNRDIIGAIAELEELERSFDKFPAIVAEAMFMRAGMLKKSGKFTESVACASDLISRYPASKKTYYAAMLAGNIFYAQQNFAGALEKFRYAAQVRSTGLEFELAQSMVIQSMLQLDSKTRLDGIAMCDRLIAASNFPYIRMEMRYRKAVALQQENKNMEALGCYELLLNEAVACAAGNVPYDRNRCLRAAVNALQITSAGATRSLFNRGMRIINRCYQLELDKAGLDPDALKKDLINKYSANRKRR